MEPLLRIWSGISLALLVAGMVLWVRTPDGARTALVLNVGLLLLIAMPVVRLVSVLIYEVQAREWRFAVLGALVIVLLGGSVLIGLM